MWNIHRLAEKKAPREEEIEDWAKLLSQAENKAREAGLNEAAFTELIESLKTDKHLVEIFEIMAEHGRRHPRNPRTFQMLAENVDESEKTLGDWLEAISRVLDWLFDRRKIATYKDILGYIWCGDEAMRGRGADKLLADEVQEQLDEHGFENARDWNENHPQAPSPTSASPGLDKA